MHPTFDEDPGAGPGAGDTGDRAATPSFDRDATTGEFAFAVLRQRFAELLEHEVGTRRGDDPTELHRMRVATRRLRTMLETFRSTLPVEADLFEPELRWLADQLGTVRDLDVQLDELVGAAASIQDATALKPVIDLLGARRTDARTRLLHALDSRRYERFVSGFATYLNRGPVGRAAVVSAPAVVPVPDLVRAGYRVLRKRARGIDRDASPRDLHRLRLACKRLRYVVEAVEPLYGKRARRMTGALVSLQDLLGAHHDAIVGEQRLHALATDDGVDLPPDTIFAMGELSAVRARRAGDARQQVPGVLHDLPDVWKPLRRKMERVAREYEAGGP